MNSRPLAIVTTRLPPLICGVGSYSWRLDQSWPRTDAGHIFLVCEGGAASRAELNFDKIVEHRCAAERLLRELEALGDCSVLLHYAARAYHRYGIPAWLCRGLERWKAQCAGGRLVVIFHEMPSKMPMTSRHFLPNFLNARIVRRLATIADAAVTNTFGQAKTLSDLTHRADVHVFPVGANIEPMDRGSDKPRRSVFVLFGLPFGRLQTLQRFVRWIPKWVQSGALSRLHVIGPRDERFSKAESEILDQCGVGALSTLHGQLPDEAVSQLLAKSAFALTNVTSETWSKSGVFMACAAHRLGVVAPGLSGSTPLEFAVDPDLVATISDAELERRVTGLQDWYNANARWPVIARRIADLFP